MNIFGIEILKKKDSLPSSPVGPADDGSTGFSGNASGYYAQVMDFDNKVKSETDLIYKYRDVAAYPDVDSAINDIVNEAIVIEEDMPSITIVLDEMKQSSSFKEKIAQEFDTVLSLLKFDELGHDLFRSWYIDGKIYVHPVIDKDKMALGILDIRKIDPRKIRKIRNVKKTKNNEGVDVVTSIDEYYLYNDKGITDSVYEGVKMPLDAVVYINSGLIDDYSGLAQSHLHKAIKPTNQLKMLEDSAVIYRLSRAPERRIFYIDVGNLPKLKAEQYVSDLMNKFRNKISYNSVTGEITDGKKHLCLSMDTKVPLLDGRALTLDEIAKEYESGKELWVYSCDPISGAFEPGLVSWAGVTRPNTQVMKLTLDNGESIVCTPEHKFPVWNKGLIEARSLMVGESMIPFYTRESGIIANTKKQEKMYHQLFQNDTGKWEFTHRLVSKWKDTTALENEFIFNEEFSNEKRSLVHHKNFNKLDNTPFNLTRMSRHDHFAYHNKCGVSGGKRCKELGVGIHAMTKEQRYEAGVKGGSIGGKVARDTGKCHESWARGREKFKILMTDESYHEWFIEQQRNGWSEEQKIAASDRAKDRDLSGLGNAAQKVLWQTEEMRNKHKRLYETEYLPEHLVHLEFCAKSNMSANATAAYLNEHVSIDDWKSININKVMVQKNYDNGVTWKEISRITRIYHGKTWAEYKESVAHRNHKIASIEYLDEKIDTGCLTIDGDEIYHSHHTFALSAGIYTKNSLNEDYWLPRRSGGSGQGTEITTLPGLQNVSQLDDLNYFQGKLFQALNVPISRLKPETGFNIGRSSEITRDEIRFNKFIHRLRSKFNGLFHELLRIQMILKGVISPDDWDSVKPLIKFRYLNDNYYASLKEDEIIQGRLALLQNIDPYVGKYYSQAWIKQNILRLSDLEMTKMDKEIEEDREKDAELAAQQAEQNPNMQQPPQQPNAEAQE